MAAPLPKNPWQVQHPAGLEFEMGEEGEQMSRSSSVESFPRDRHDFLRSASVTSSNYPLESNSPKRSFLQKGLPKAAKVAFIVLNAITLLLFLAFIAVDLFVIFSSYQTLFHISFKLALFFVGLSGSLLAITGIVGVAKEHRILLMIYFSFLLILFLLELGFFIFLMSGREKLSLILQGTWSSSTDEMRNVIQSEFECCGYRDPSDSPGSHCEADWQEGCLPVIKQSMNQHLPLVLGISCSFIFIELVSLVLSLYLIIRLPNKKQLIALELEEAWRKTLGGDHEPLEVF